MRLVAKVEVGFVILCGINRNYALLGERNVDIKHTNCETDNECWPRNVVQNGHLQYDHRYNLFTLYFSLQLIALHIIASS